MELEDILDLQSLLCCKDAQTSNYVDNDKVKGSQGYDDYIRFSERIIFGQLRNSRNKNISLQSQNKFKDH